MADPTTHSGHEGHLAIEIKADGLHQVLSQVLVWILIVSVLLYRRETGPAERQTPVDPASPAQA